MAIDGPGRGLLVETVDELDSTNSELLRRDPLLPPDSGAEAIWLVARRQTAGRGRRQRAWVSREGTSLTASFAREVEGPARLGGLQIREDLLLLREVDQHRVAARGFGRRRLCRGGGGEGGDQERGGQDGGDPAQHAGPFCEARTTPRSSDLGILPLPDP